MSDIPAPESSQTSEFRSESLRFVREHLHDSTPAPDWVVESQWLMDASVASILDVGCGAGVLLSSLVNHFGEVEAIGVEPSNDAVDLLNQRYIKDPRIRFTQGSVDRMPFENDSFDLVVCWSVLHGVGRNDYLQALGELIRVTKTYLLVMDFSAAEDYRVPYAHRQGLFTYKQDFVAPILASGIMKNLNEHRWWDNNTPGVVHPIDETQLEQFLGNPLNYHARRGVLFAKDYSALPVYEESDFSQA